MKNRINNLGIFKLLAFSLAIVTTSSSFSQSYTSYNQFGGAYSRRGYGNGYGNGNFSRKNNSGHGSIGTNPQWEKIKTDKDLVLAVQRRAKISYLQAGSLKVIQLLPDDLSGLKHQKFVTRLSNGNQVQIVYNLDLCERVPVRIGDVVSVGGEFIWTPQGGLVHWVHRDPKGFRKDGYVEHFGKFYCR